MDQEEIQIQINAINNTLGKLQQELVLHDHKGNATTVIDYKSINQKKIYINHTIYGADAATAANYGVFYITPVPCLLNDFKEVHETAGSDGSAVTLTLEKLISGVAPDSGVVMLNSTLSLKATANTVQTGATTLTSANRTLAIGDRLCLKDAGVLTDVANVTILVELIVL